MFKYFSYYSIGGYKDLYLGTSEMSESYTYYLPLLSIQKKKAESGDDKDALKKISELDALPKIRLANKTNNFGLPAFGSKLISHGGYKLIFTHAENDTFILTLRDIKGDNKDESGRAIPFLIMIVADNTNDANTLAGIAAYWSNHLYTVSTKISTYFAYDPVVNGVKFNLKEFNLLLEECSNKQSEIETVTGKLAIDVKTNTVGALLVLPGITHTLLNEELNIKDKKVNFIPLTNVLPNDNSEKARKMLLQAHKSYQRKKRILYCIIGAVCFIGFIVFLILKCLHK